MKPVISPIKMMTYDQRQLLRLGYESLRPISRPFALLFYGKLFELEPATRSLFSKDIAEQGRKLMSMLDAIITSLDDFEPMRSKLHELGRKHVNYGVKDHQYPVLSSALLWALAQALESDFDPPARAAWMTAIQSVTEAMLDGAHSVIASHGDGRAPDSA